MKVKVSGITYKEFLEFAESGFARVVNMTLYIFLALMSLVSAFALLKNAGEALLKPLFICTGVLILLIVTSKAGMGAVFKHSGLSEETFVYSFDEYGMDIKIGKLSGDLGWEYVKYSVETDNLLIIRAKGSQFIIPKRCVANKGLKELLEEKTLLKKRMNKSGKRNNAPKGDNGEDKKE